MYFRINKTHHEYHNLIKSSFEKLNPEMQNIIYKKIDEGFNSEKFEKIKSEEGKRNCNKTKKILSINRVRNLSKKHLDEKNIFQFTMN